MTDLVAIAAMNNILQSEAVLAALGSSGSFTDEFWMNNHNFDIPYANGATLGSGNDPARHYAAIERFSNSRTTGNLTHIMDSWANLDLSSSGYRVRLADEWFMRLKPAPVAAKPASHPVEVITSADGLAEYEAASATGFGGVSPAVPGHTYPPKLLMDRRFTFFSLRVEDKLAAGAFLFRDSQCIGVFTLFTLPDYRGNGLGTAVLEHALNQTLDLPLVTNPSAMSRGIFSRLGFRAVGERRIWARTLDDI